MEHLELPFFCYPADIYFTFIIGKTKCTFFQNEKYIF